MVSNKINFYGCPAGLGNRFEELKLLSSYAIKNNIHITYYWNNSSEIKLRPVFSSKNLNIIEINNLKSWPTKNFESSRHWREYISKDNIYYDENVKLNINFPEINKKYIGIHIRGTDRIVSGTNYHSSFQTLEDLEYCINETKRSLINTELNLPIVIFSEDINLKKRLLNDFCDFNVIELPRIDNIEKVYEDFYYLSLAKKIILCSKFSTFSLSAAMLNNAEVVKFYNYTDPSLKRWKNNFIVKLNSYDNGLTSKKNFKQTKEVLVGNNFVKSFRVESNCIELTKTFISYNTTEFYGFEEHFKILNPEAKVIFKKVSIFIQLLKKIIKTVRHEKNRKTKIQYLVKESFKTLKIFGFKTFFKFEINFNNFRKYFFIYSNFKNLDNEIYKLLGKRYFLAAIFEIDKGFIANEKIVQLEKFCSKNGINFMKVNHEDVYKLNYIYLTNKNVELSND